MTLRELLIGLGFKIDESSEKKAEQGIQGLKDKATQLLGAIGIGFSLANLNELSEEFRTTNDQIAQATRLLGDQDEIQQKILDSANRTRATYADTARMVSNLVRKIQICSAQLMRPLPSTTRPPCYSARPVKPMSRLPA